MIVSRGWFLALYTFSYYPLCLWLPNYAFNLCTSPYYLLLEIIYSYNHYSILNMYCKGTLLTTNKRTINSSAYYFVVTIKQLVH